MSGMRIRVNVDGVDRTVSNFHVTGWRAKHNTPVMQRIFMDMLQVEKEVFVTQGGRTGHKWKPLRPSTVRQKGHSTILIDTGALLYSVTEFGAPYQIKKISTDRVELGTTRPGARAHQFGWAGDPAVIKYMEEEGGRSTYESPRAGARQTGLPSRRFLTFKREDVLRWNRWIADYTLDRFKTGKPNGTRI